ncbi:hypothetical protein G9P44_004685 [Scheffersomyces stipitis]|nr:hypothetical protein G9P44_004685 [Scheffersomyces stipitis]
MFRSQITHICKRTPVGGSVRFGLSFSRPIRHNVVIQTRNLNLSPSALGAVKNYGFVINLIAGAYIGGLLVSFGSLYFMYHDANERQNIPFELSFKDQITAVKAINKDDVLKSPRYAVKHYRRLLIEMAKKENPNLEFDEESDENRYEVPILDSKTLVYKKSSSFSNFYIDIVMRYARALLAKGQLEASVYVLRKIIDDDEIFYKLGDAERLSQCCRLLTRVFPDPQVKVAYLQRSIDMLTLTFSSMNLNEDFLLQENSKLTDELLNCLNDLAFTMAKISSVSGVSKSDKKDLLTKSLNIYLANIKKLTEIKDKSERGELVQTVYPLFNCDENNVDISIYEIKAHISEIMWAKGFKKNAVSWSEDIVEHLYFDHNTTARVSILLYNVLNNLVNMYDGLKDVTSRRRCEKLMDELVVFNEDSQGWYDSVINRFSKIIYNRGPLGIIEKPLLERFGSPKRLPEIEEFEEEDVE